MTIHADPLKGFIESAHAFPMLSREEETALAQKWRKHKDLDAAQKIANCHLRLVVKMAFGFRGYGLPVADLIQEGNVGLMKAIKRFEPERDIRFCTYAVWWIRASIYDHILRSWSLVRIGTTPSQKTLFFNLRKIKARIGAYDEGDLRDEDVLKISQVLNVPQRDVVQMNRRMIRDGSLNDLVRNDQGDGIVEFQDRLVDDAPNSEDLLTAEEEYGDRLKAMESALVVLDEREKRIFQARHLSETPLTLKTLGDEFGITKERVRQLGDRAFKKVQAETYRRMMELTPRKGSFTVA